MNYFTLLTNMKEATSILEKSACGMKNSNPYLFLNTLANSYRTISLGGNSVAYVQDMPGLDLWGAINPELF